jgi:hypothetical protein
MDALTFPIASLKLFNDDKALIAADIEGESALCMINNLGPVLNPSEFKFCSICMQPLTSNAICCHYCGKAVCKTCRESSKICLVCYSTKHIQESESENV